MRDHLTFLWDRLILDTTPPEPLWLIAMAVVALGIVTTPNMWPNARLVITIVHEVGHAVTGLLTGNKPTALHINHDTSGSTDIIAQRGIISWPGRWLTTFMGYPFPAVVAAMLSLSMYFEKGSVSVAIMCALTLGALALVRNFRSFCIIFLANIATFSLFLWAPPTLLTFLLTLLLCFLIVGGLKTVWELSVHHLRGDRESSDVAIMTRYFPPLEPLIFALFLAMYGASTFFIISVVFKCL